LDFQGKSVLLTGASSGIGRAVAIALARQGARLLLTGRSRERLAEVAGECAPAQVDFHVADLSQPEQVVELAAAARRHFRRLDLLIHNAGVGLYAPSYQADPAQVRTVFEVNYFAPVELTRRLLPDINAGGAVVAVSSIGGMLALPWQNAYSSSKFALNGFTYCLRMELEGSGVDALCFCPCLVETPFREHALAGDIPPAVAARQNIRISAERCADDLLQAIRKRKRTTVSPWNGWLLVWLSRLFPRTVERRMARMNSARAPVAGS
jgi:short-subunit dehydrogenase